MIKLIVFDLDGVLVETRELHYQALNKALELIDPKYTISLQEHAATYDGMTTTKKLNLLTEKKGLPKSLHQTVWENKQKATLEVIEEQVKPIPHILKMLQDIKEKYDIKIAVASNSISKSISYLLIYSKLMPYVDFIYSNEDVNNPKPHPEIYMKCMVKAGTGPGETLIVEDSHIGRKSALESGAFLCAVKDPYDLNFIKIDNILKQQNAINYKPKWIDKTLNILIPMAGAGTRFEKAGYTFPKPLIEIHGKPMIQTVVENLNIDAHYIFIVQKKHYEKYNLGHLLKLLAPGCQIIQTDGLTEGAACTTLLAKEYINNDHPLLICNSDQFIKWDSNSFMYAMTSEGVDGGILTFTSTHPKWSFAKLNDDGFISEVAEKMPISDLATVGVYYFAKGSGYVKAAEKMIAENDRFNNEFYVCPVFNHFIAEGNKVRSYKVEEMWGLGTPEDLDNFLKEYKE